MRLYLDTNVIMDFLIGRNPAAYDLLVRTLACKHTFMISPLVLKELDKYGFLDASGIFISTCEKRKKIVVCAITPEDVEYAKTLSTHHADALHYTIACLHGAEAFVTGNVDDFPFTTIPVFRVDDI